MPEDIKQSVLTVRLNDSAVPVGNEDLRLIHLSRTVRHRNPNFFRQLAYVLDVSEAEAAAFWNGRNGSSLTENVCNQHTLS